MVKCLSAFSFFNYVSYLTRIVVATCALFELNGSQCLGKEAVGLDVRRQCCKG